MSKLAKALTAAAGNAGGEAVYVEDVFSTYLYTGNGSTQTITNDIDLYGEGGLVWLKSRNITYSNVLVDTERGASYAHFTNLTIAQQTSYPYISSFNSNGFTLGNMSATNALDYTYTSWTFRKAKKFFDIVTWTGNGDGTDRNYNHNLNSVPNCVIVKRTDTPMDWGVYHSQLGTGGGSGLKLNTTGSIDSPNPIRTTPSSTQIKIRGASGEYNENGATYIAYLFASDAGGFGDDGSESIIKCGSFTGNGQVDLGFEPQFLLYKPYTQIYDWKIADNMRRLDAASSSVLELEPNSSDTEANGSDIKINATGFYNWTFGVSYPCIYIAIRRPMKTPESGTEVFSPFEYTGGGSGGTTTLSTGFPVDMYLGSETQYNGDRMVFDRLRGSSARLRANSTAAQDTQSLTSFDLSDTFKVTGILNNSGRYGGWAFKRAPGFFDVVAYTGDGGTTQTLNHNLGVTPEFMIAKRRNDTQNWVVYHSLVGAGKYYNLNTTSGASTLSTVWGGVEPTSTQFTVGNSTTVNFNGDTYISYHFATCPGVSKVGSYTGSGTTKQIDCGFTGGARFVLIKRTDSTGDWYVWDTARGIVAGNDPYLLLNSTAAEATSTDYIDPYSAGFEISSTAPAAINASGGTYIFLAIA